MEMVIKSEDGKMQSIELRNVNEDKQVAQKDFDNVCLLFAKNLSNVTGSDLEAVKTFENLLQHANEIGLKLQQ